MTDQLKRNAEIEEILSKNPIIYKYRISSSDKYDNFVPVGNNTYEIQVIEPEVVGGGKNSYLPKNFNQRDSLLKELQKSINISKLEYFYTKKFRNKYYSIYMFSENK